MKTSHFEGCIAYWAAKAAHGRNERTHSEHTAFDINFGGQWLVQPAKKGQSIEWFVFDLIWRRPSAVYGFMPRKLRVQYSGAMYHVMSRGDRGEDIFLDEANLHKWMQARASENPTQSHS